MSVPGYLHSSSMWTVTASDKRNRQLKREFTAWWFLGQPLSEDVTNELDISPPTSRKMARQPGPLRYRGLTITLRHTHKHTLRHTLKHTLRHTFGRVPTDE
jgi:hypothetical protein